MTTLLPGTSGDDIQTVQYTSGDAVTWDGGDGDDRLIIDLTTTDVPYYIRIDDSGTSINNGDMTIVTTSVEHLTVNTSNSAQDVEVFTGDITINTGSSDDTVLVGQGSTGHVNSGDGNDEIYVSGSGDVNAGAGDDAIDVEGSATLVDGGDGNDSLSFTMGSGTYDAVAAATSTGTTLGNGTLIKNVEHLIELFGGDHLIISAAQGSFEWAGGGSHLTADYSTVTSDMTWQNGGLTWSDGSGIDETEGSSEITTGSGNDSLHDDGFADTFTGGVGNDSYYVDNAATVVVEKADEGSDTVFATVNYTLTDNIENATLTSIVPKYAIGGVLNGNDRANILTGNGGDNTLNGGGGNDTLYGGDDVFAVKPSIYYLDYSSTIALHDTYHNAMFIDATLFGNDPDNNIYKSNDWLHGTILGSGSNHFKVYKITIAQNGTEAIFDIDQTNFNSCLTLYNANGSAIAFNNDSPVTSGGGGSTSANDAFLDVALNAGTYYIEVASYQNSARHTINTGSNYVLNISTNLLLAPPANNDLLDGGAGADTMYGGSGNDTYIVDNGADVVHENSNAGDDTVKSSVSYVLSANVENLILTGTGDINGTASGDGTYCFIQGNSGNNTLNDSGWASELTGGAGDDSYIVAGVGTIIHEDQNGGYDTVYVQTDEIFQADQVEKIVLQGNHSGSAYGDNSISSTLVGDDSDNDLFGGYFADTIIGNGGNDLLDGAGGGDVMSGGLGDDTYYVYGSNDLVTELADQGTDVVYSTASYTLGADIENLILEENGNINATGNALANSLTGNSSDNVLDGGAGADIMTGGQGNDTYIVDNTGDVVTENTGEGTDTVRSYISYALGSDVENLSLTGSANIDGTGNSLDNVLTGNSGNNTLDGGAGADKMYGGAGNDTYFIDNAGDRANEYTHSGIDDGGTDTVNSTLSITLGTYLENLNLIGGALTGVGNALNNVITGSALNNTLKGMDGNDTLIGGLGADKMYGGGGNDTYYVDDVLDKTYEYTTVGVDDGGIDTVVSSVNLTLGIYLENLTITGSAANGIGNELNNTIIGDDLDNIIKGLAGNDVLMGGLGADKMYGGAGNDTYYVDNAGDRTYEYTTAGVDDGGNDTVVSSLSLTLGVYLENLTLTGAAVNGVGNELDNMIVGDALDNTIRGMDGNDTLDGGAGADRMFGGAGNDTYIVDNAGDRAYEYTTSGVDDGGNDTVQTWIDYTLGSYVENLTLLGSGNLNGTGNALANVITGNVGDNKLDGAGGADSLYGGLGNDTYVVDNNAGDLVVEKANEGTDTVQTASSYILGNNLENLVLTGTLNRSGYGNSLDNVITGNSGDNALKGYDGNDTLDGGLGNDTLTGGNGDDTYVLDNAGEIVVENANQGTDTVQAAFSYTLLANFENLTLLGAGNLNGTGNSADNVITGNSGINLLQGLDGNDTLDGGLGADTMQGGLGNDSYYVDNAGDIVTENANAGTDTVYSALAAYTLGSNVENLTLLGSGNLNATGNSLANLIIGNAGNNILDGGTGADTMQGGLGDDTYMIDNSGDVVTENANEGIDTVITASSYILGANLENLVLTGSVDRSGYGNALDNVITGNTGSNALKGYAGNDTLDGGAGNDTLLGGVGADIFLFKAGSGVDTISDFTASQGDTINVHAYTNGTVHAEYIQTVGGNVVIDLGGGNTITITGGYAPDVTAHMVW